MAIPLSHSFLCDADKRDQAGEHGAPTGGEHFQVCGEPGGAARFEEAKRGCECFSDPEVYSDVRLEREESKGFFVLCVFNQVVAEIRTNQTKDVIALVL